MAGVLAANRGILPRRELLESAVDNSGYTLMVAGPTGGNWILKNGVTDVEIRFRKLEEIHTFALTTQSKCRFSIYNIRGGRCAHARRSMHAYSKGTIDEVLPHCLAAHFCRM